MKNFKKVVAGLSAMTLIAMNTSLFNANAANFVDADLTATYTYSDTTTTDDTFSFSIAGGTATDADGGDAGTASNEITISVRNSSSAVVDLSSSVLTYTNAAEVSKDLATGNIVLTVTDVASIATVDFAAGFTDLATGNYFVSVSSQDQTGAKSFSVNAANEVIVTASVAPILTMALTTTGNSESAGTPAFSQSFGTLTAGTPTTITIADIEIGTNAVNGATVLASSTNGGLFSSTASWKIIDLITDTVGLTAGGADADHTGETYNITSIINDQDDDITTAAAKDGALTNNSITKAAYVDTNAAIYDSKGPENNTLVKDITVQLTAQPSTLTPTAADYTDTITFTVTGSF